jgi:hypothetical protein
MWHGSELEMAQHRAHIRFMGNFARIAVLAALTLLTLGVFPNKRAGAVIAIGICVVAAVALHFLCALRQASMTPKRPRDSNQLGKLIKCRNATIKLSHYPWPIPPIPLTRVTES